MSPRVIQITTTPGTPVQVSVDQLKCAQVWAVNLSASQVVAFGNKDLNLVTKAGIIALIPPTSSGATPDSQVMKLPPDAMGEDPYDLRDYYVDSTTAALVNIIPFIF